MPRDILHVLVLADIEEMRKAGKLEKISKEVDYGTPDS